MRPGGPQRVTRAIWQRSGGDIAEQVYFESVAACGPTKAKFALLRTTSLLQHQNSNTIARLSSSYKPQTGMQFVCARPLLTAESQLNGSSALASALKPREPPSRSSPRPRAEEHTSELQSRLHLVCRLLLEKK